MLRFKSSIASAAAKKSVKPGTEGHIQIVADNFDANISSPNSLK